ncbi:MAG: hypothetical protein ACKPKO_55580, partial [Candidatus Fonsibacter sp.]
ARIGASMLLLTPLSDMVSGVGAEMGLGIDCYTPRQLSIPAQVSIGLALVGTQFARRCQSCDQ